MDDVVRQFGEIIYHQLFEYMPNVVVVTDKLGKIIVTNSQMEKLFGCPPAELVERSVEMLLAERSRHNFTRQQKKILVNPRVSSTNIDGELYGRHQDGHEFPIEITLRFLKIKNNSLFIHTIHDISKQHQAMAELRESENRFRQLSNITFEGIAIHENGKIIDANQTLADMFGYKLSEFIGMNALECTAPESRELLTKNIRSGYEKPYEAVGLRKDGSTFPVEIIGKTETCHSHTIRVAAIRDITERKKAEETLAASEKKYRQLFESTLDGIVMTDKNGRVITANPAAVKILGFQRERDLIGKSAINFYSNPEDRHRILDKLVKKEALSDIEVEGKRKDGSVFNVIVSFRLQKDEGGNLRQVESIFKDITQRKRAEEKLRLLSQITEQVSYSVLTTNLKFEINWVNRAFQELYGYSLKEVFGRTPDFLNSEPTSEQIQKDIYQTVSSGKEWKGEVLNCRKDGSTFPCELMIFPIRDENGKIFAYAGHQQNISERKKAEEALRKSESKWRSLTENSPDYIMLLDQNLIIQFINHTESALTPEKVMGTHISKYVPKKYWPEMKRCFEGVWKTGKPDRYEMEYLSIDGTFTKFFEGRVRPIIHNDEIVSLIVNASDITERKLAEKAIKSSYKQVRDLSAHLQSVRDEERAHIAREIHDELGQTLTALKMDLAWILNKIPEGHTNVSEKINSMKHLIDSTIETVHEITSKLRPKLLDDLGVIEAMNWLAQETQKRSGIICEVSTNLEEINLDNQLATAIYRIYQETLTNVVRHSNATRVEISLNKINGQLELKVKDDGKGFTQNELKKSTSFGLIGIRERARAWGGKVEIEGIQNKGARVRVTIPLD